MRVEDLDGYRDWAPAVVERRNFAASLKRTSVSEYTLPPAAQVLLEFRSFSQAREKALQQQRAEAERVAEWEAKSSAYADELSKKLSTILEARRSRRGEQLKRAKARIEFEEKQRELELRKHQIEVQAERDMLAAKSAEQKRELEALETSRLKAETLRLDAERSAREEAAKVRAAAAEKERLAAEAKALKAAQEVGAAKAKMNAANKAQRELTIKGDEKAKADVTADTRAQPQALTQPTSSSDDGTDWTRVQEEFNAHKKTIVQIKEAVVGSIMKDPRLRQVCLSIRTRLTPRVGQLTNSKKQLVEVHAEISQVLRSAQAEGELVYQYALNVVSKLAVSQAESEVPADIQSAIPLASLMVLIWRDFKQLGDYLIPRIVKKCPYVIGYLCSTESREGRSRMGYHDKEDKYETEDKYELRMVGITAFWTAMTQTKLAIKSGVKHPYPIHHGWIFVARMLNRSRSELSNVHFGVAAIWWDIGAKRFEEAFGRQGSKALTLLTKTWPLDADAAKMPSCARLRLLGDEWRRKGYIEPAWKPLDP